MEKYFYFVITPAATVDTVEIKEGRSPVLEELQQAVGGYIEIVGGPLYPVVGIVNEEGRLQGLEDNPFGSMALRYPEPLCGNVVILQAEGEELVGFTEKDAVRIKHSLRQICVLFGSFFRAGGEG